MVAAEALIRWPQKFGAPTEARRFLPRLRSLNLLTQLTRPILESVTVVFNSLPESESAHFRISINVSEEQLLSSSFLRDLEAVTRNQQSWVDLEVTEALIQKNPTVIPILQRAIALGAGLIIDDFCDGPASVLTQLPVRAVKVDLARYALATTHEDLTRSVQAAVARGVPAIAARIEGEESIRLAGELGCYFRQGYAYGAAVPGIQLARALLSPLDTWTREVRGLAA
jgi:EAL domain-containing protein (putative c-di-GMP-specific phosphodiesterase class I)